MMRTEALRPARVDTAVNQAWHWLAARFRRKRRAMLLRRFPSKLFPRVIDVGGIAKDWVADERVVTILNPVSEESGRHHCVIGDGRHLAFGDDTFDLAYCNSVIEHLGGWEDQKMLAAELRRIAPALWVQTPNRWFPLEVHYLTLFLHWWPALLRNYFLVRWLTGWGWLVRPNRDQVRAYAETVHLLSAREMKQLFPDCTLLRERFLGITKSHICVRQQRS
jgi:hypothetical protein